MNSFKFMAKGLVFLLIGFAAVTCEIAMIQSIASAAEGYKRDIKNFLPPPSVKLKIPAVEIKTAETSYMVAFVAPEYEDTMAKYMRERQLQIQQQMEQTGYAAGMYRKMDAAQNDYFDSLKKNLQLDLEQILLKKKIRVAGTTFKSRDEMTFDEKKRAIYTFTPKILIQVNSQSSIKSEKLPYIEEGTMTVSGEISFILRESITGEKVWVKRMEAEPVTKSYKFVAGYKNTYIMDLEPSCIGCLPPTSKFASMKIKEQDDTDKVLISAVSEFYEAMSDKIWKHIDTEEWEKYLAQAEKLRAEKRY